METTEIMYGNVKKCFQKIADMTGIIRRKQWGVLSGYMHGMADAFPAFKHETEKLLSVVKEREKLNTEIGARHQHNIVAKYSAARMFNGWEK